MAIGMAWGSDWVGMAYAVLPDTEACCAALRGSLRRSLRVVHPRQRGCILRHANEQLQARIRGEGHAAIAAGRSWHTESGPVWLSLEPHKDE